jgi:hypothetical protein
MAPTPKKTLVALINPTPPHKPLDQLSEDEFRDWASYLWTTQIKPAIDSVQDTRPAADEE